MVAVLSGLRTRARVRTAARAPGAGEARGRGLRVLGAVAALLGATASSVVGLTAPPALASAPAGWTTFGFDAGSTHTNPIETKIGLGNVSSLAPLWQANPTGSAIEGSPVIVSGVAYVSSLDHYLYAYDAAGSGCSGTPRTCTPLWKADLGGRGDWAAPTVANGVVYIHAAGSSLRAYDAAGVQGCTGSPKLCTPLWTATTNTLYSTQLVPVVAGGRVYVGPEVFDAAGVTGCSGAPKQCSPLWADTTTDIFGFAGSPVVVGGLAYIATGNGSLSVYDAAGATGCSGTPVTCTALWTGPTDGGGAVRTPLVSGGRVYLATANKTLFVFDAAGSTGCSGAPKVCQPLWTAPGVRGGLALANGVLYATAGDPTHLLLAFDATGTSGCSGSPKVCTPSWTGDGTPGSGAWGTTEPAVANGLVFVGSTDGKLHAFDAAGATGCSGAPKLCPSVWSHVVGSGSFVRSAAVVWDGIVYIGGSGGTFEAFSVPPPPVPTAPTAVLAAAGNGRVTVSWSPPTSNGGSAITGYTIRTYQGGTLVPSVTCPWNGGPLWCDATGLTNGTAYTFTVTATNAVGPGPASAPTTAVTPDGGSRFHPLAAPARILDSRPPPEQVGPFATPWATGTSRAVTVAGVGGIPSSATAVALNVTVTGTTAGSFLTLWPAGAPQPTASTLNWVAGQTVPNTATVKVGAGGQVSLFNSSGAANVIVDAVVYYDTSGTGDGYTPLAPARILDSRPPPEQVGPYATPWAAGTDRAVTVTGVGGVPTDADAVVLNVTATGTSAPSFLTAYPAGAAKPLASNLNWTTGQTVPNGVTVKVGAGGQIRLFNNSGTANVIVDVVGYFKAGAGATFHPVTPARIEDSRPPPESVGGYATPWGPVTSRTVSVLNGGIVPASATAVLANLTVTATTAESFLTVWPDGTDQPTASMLNWRPGVTIANGLTARVGYVAAVCSLTGCPSSYGAAIDVFNNSGSAHVITDVSGWYG